MAKAKQEGSLNLLKLLATAVIVLHHLQQITKVVFEGHINFHGGNFYWGYIVELFFILSGYFSFKYIKSVYSDKTFASFWIKKYSRFLPLLLTTGIANTIVSYWVITTRGAEFKYTLWDILGSSFGFAHWFSASSKVNNPTWYISILLLCFAVFYLGTFIAKRMKINPSSVYLLIVISGLLMNHVCSKYSFIMPFFSSYIARGLISFFWGLLFREITHLYEPHRKPCWLALCALFLASFIVVYINQNTFVSTNLQYLLCFTVFPCVIILFKMEWLQQLCSADIFTTFSNITFHTYMWHLTVIQVCINVCKISGIFYETRSFMYICLFFAFLTGTVSLCLTNSIENILQKRKQSQTNQ